MGIEADTSAQLEDEFDTDDEGAMFDDTTNNDDDETDGKRSKKKFVDAVITNTNPDENGGFRIYLGDDHKNLECRFYENLFPDIESVVMVNVRNIADMGAYVSLLEYNNIEGMILLSELSRRRIRSGTKAGVVVAVLKIIVTFNAPGQLIPWVARSTSRWNTPVLRTVIVGG